MKKAATCVMQIAANCFMIIYYILSESIIDEQEDVQESPDYKMSKNECMLNF